MTLNPKQMLISADPPLVVVIPLRWPSL